ncbi:MAG: SurA N-terminal domain-containing protein [Prolixibacteraceae bacterium]|nr:SurA N-terminal domain-containing protein [Prolixibacteraceae bacterium]
MATLQKLRNQAGLLVAIVIFIALAAFILGDLLQSGSSVIRGQQLEIAEIDGESIEYPEFQERFNQISEVYKQNNQVNTLNEEAYQQILNQTWNDIVREVIMNDVYDEIGIEVTSEEMFDLVQGNNLHPIIQQVFGNQQTGQVDKGQIIQFLKYINENPDAPQKASWLNIEKEILKAQKYTKYTDLVAKGLYANSLQAQQNLAVKNKVADLKFIQKKFSTVPDSTIAVTEKELKAYYDNHIDNYKQEAQKVIKYVAFNIDPSEQDEKDVVKWINDIKDDFANAEDNEQFVNMNADTRFEDVYDKADVMSEELAEWAFNAEINDVYGPYKENNVYKLAKLNDTRMLPDSVRASHILLRVENANQAQGAAQTIDSLKTVIENGEATFEEVARNNSQDGSAADGGDLGWFNRGAMVAPFERAAFRAERNEIVQVQTQFGFHLIKVTEQGPKSKHVQLAILDRAVTPSTNTYQEIYAQASRFAANAQDLEGFNSQIAEDGLRARNATIQENDRQVAGLGAARNIARAAFQETDEGELVVGNDNSAVFELDDKFIVAAVVSETEEGHRALQSVESSVELAVIKEKKKEMLLNNFNNALGSTIEETAGNLDLQVESAQGFNFEFGSVNAIGYEPAINGAAAALEVNEQSEPIAGRNGVYIIELTSVAGEPSQDIETIKESLYQNASYRANYQAYETLKENTEIEDKRSKFY